MLRSQREGFDSALIIFSNQTEAKEVQSEATMKAVKPSILDFSPLPSPSNLPSRSCPRITLVESRANSSGDQWSANDHSPASARTNGAVCMCSSMAGALTSPSMRLPASLEASFALLRTSRTNSSRRRP